MTFAEHVRLLGRTRRSSVASGFCIPAAKFSARKDFLDIYTEAKKARLSHHPLHQWDPDHSADLPITSRNTAPSPSEITLYGATRETYETLTRIPAPLTAAEAVRLLKERGLASQTKDVPTTINVHEVYE